MRSGSASRSATAGSLRLAIVLGLVSAIGPFAIDMYLPALPSIGDSLHAGPGAVQMTVFAFFLALAVGQPVYGPLSDMLGRKPPLYAGLALFAAASVGCALAPSVGVLIACRFVQGLGACAGMVVPRAVVRDLHTGVAGARLMSLLMLVFSISPILAPLVGSLIIGVAGWRAVFWVVTVAAMLGAAMLATQLAETRTAAQRRGSGLRSVVPSYVRLLRDRRFLGLSLLGGFAMASFFAYLSNSPFVMIEHYRLSPSAYGILSGVNAASFFAAAQLNGWLGARFGLVRTVRAAVMAYAAVMLTLFVLFAGGVDRLDVLAVLLFAGFGCLGLVVPTASVLALEDHGAIAGTASALLGTLQFVTGAAVMLLSGLFLDGTARPMVAAIAACSLVCLGLAHGTLGFARVRGAAS